MINARTIIAAAAAAAMLAGCGGGGGSSLPAQASGGLALSIAVPGASTTLKNGKRLPLYVSRATHGLGIEYQTASGGYSGAPSASPTFGTAINAGSGSCGAANTDGSFTCTVYIPSIPVGYSDLRISLWNTAPTGCSSTGKGCSFLASGDKVLSFASQPDYGIIAGLNNTLNVTLLPVVDSISGTLSTGIDNTNSSVVTGYVNAKDAAGELILTGDQLVDAGGNNLTITLGVSNDLPGGCTAINGSGSCSLYFTGSTGTAPTITNFRSGNSGTITYDGSQSFPTNGISEPAVTFTVTGGSIAGSNLPGVFTVCAAATPACPALPGGTQ